MKADSNPDFNGATVDESRLITDDYKETTRFDCGTVRQRAMAVGTAYHFTRARQWPRSAPDSYGDLPRHLRFDHRLRFGYIWRG